MLRPSAALAVRVALLAVVRLAHVVVIRLGPVIVIRLALVAVIRLVFVVAVGLALVVRLHRRAWVGQRLRSITEIKRTHGGCCRGDDQTDNDVGEERGETRKHDRKQE